MRISDWSSDVCSSDLTSEVSPAFHYMPQWKAGDTSLVFDAFASVSRDEPLLMAWRDTDLSEAQRGLLDDLLNAMGYLGRAESWVEARRLPASEQRSEEHTSELQSLMRSSYAVFCLKKKKIRRHK